MRKKIIFDMDGVLADFTAGVTPLLEKHLGKIPSYEMVNQNWPRRWNFSDLGATQDDVRSIWEHIIKTENFWENLPYLPGYTGLYAALYRGDLLGNDLIFLTARCDTLGDSAHKQTERWVTRMLGLDNPHVIVVPNALGKLKILEALAEFPVYYLDDFAPTVQMAKYLCKAYMLRQPWNREDERSYSIPSVDSVHEFLEEVKRG